MWTKLFSLIWLDPPLWLQNAFRFATGQMPYRDYSYPYPPLGVAIFGWAFRWLGARFTVAQLVMDVLSLGIVLAAFVLVRELLPKALHALVCILLIAVCATAQTYFSLFSLLGYTPSLQVAALGLLLLLLGGFRYVDQGRFRMGNLSVMAIGSAVALLSKQEPLLVVPGFLGILAIRDRRLCFRDRPSSQWVRAYFGLGCLCVVPSAAVMLLIMARAGTHNFAAAMRGYGLATVPCPWWPTGLGVLGAGAAIGCALAFAAAASLFEWRTWRARLGARYAALLVLSLVGLCVYLIFQWNSAAGSYFRASEGPLKKAVDLAATLLSTSSVLRPVLWVVLPYWLALLIRRFRAGSVNREETKLVLLLTVPALIGIRSLFGNTLTAGAEVPALSVPFLLLVGPYMLLRFLEFPHGLPATARLEGSRVPVMIVGAAAAFYVVVRIVGAYPSILSDRQYTRLETVAGSVWVRDGAVNAGIYDYVVSHTATDETILELPYGGGMSVATGRRMPTFTTHFAGGFTMEPHYQALDVERLKAAPPAVVIAKDDPHYGAFNGIKGTMGCVFPRLVWEPDRLSWDPLAVLPLVDYIERNYHVDHTVGGWLLLRPNDSRAVSAARFSR